MVIRRVTLQAQPDSCPSGIPSARRAAEPDRGPHAQAGQLTVLVQGQSGAVWRTLLRLGVAREALDDATQEVFIVIARRIDQIEPGRERAFLYATAVRVAANQRRAQRSRREQTLEQLHPAPLLAQLSQEDLLDQKRMRELLDRMLEAMPDELREVFVLFELEEFTRTEIGRILGVPTGTVASRLRRAREAFERLCATRERASQGDDR